MAQVWEVIGGADKGGIIVREGKELNSTQTAERLATGAVVRELELEGERLHFEKLRGAGPGTGWVSLRLRSTPLLQRAPATGTADTSAWATVPAAECLAQPSLPVRASRARRTPRIVCLHGTASGERIFKMQLGKFIAAARDKVDLLFLEGPICVTSGPAWETMQQFFPGQHNAAYDEVSLDNKGWRVYRDPRGTLAWLQERLASLGPVDGILGFSQGANFAVMLAAQSSTGFGVPLGCCVLLCPNAPGYIDQLPELFGAPVQVPALVVYGEQESYGAGMEALFDAALEDGHFDLDTRGGSVPAEIVAGMFAKTEIMPHSEGHRPLPSDRQQAKAVIDRVLAYINEHT